jgi:glutamate dehydrogenase (NADP+)
VLLEDAKELIARGVTIVLEGANMPTDNDAIDALHAAGVVLAAGKACNAGGVAVSGLEMAQNATMSVWTREEVDQRLQVCVGGGEGHAVVGVGVWKGRPGEVAAQPPK